jgi:ankyrin repeat protein
MRIAPPYAGAQRAVCSATLASRSCGGYRSGVGEVSPLLQAVYRGDRETAASLLAEAPPGDVFEAAAVGDVARLRELLDADRSLANAWSADGAGPLHLAAYFGHPDAVGLLVERGADVDAHARGFNGVAPLNSAAATSGSDEATSTECVRILLEAGADPNARQGGGLTALHSAALSRCAEMARLLVEHGGDRDAETDDGRTPHTMAPELFGER